jgi:predicted RNA-binding Zn-ribbon protein involved in translation (DUF1610 family)
MNLRQQFMAGIADTALTQTFDRTSRWAVARRTMQDGEPYSLIDYPYITEILNSRSQKNWIMKCAQSGLTEGGITIGLCEIDYHGRDVIYYFPTGKMAERFSKTRFASAIKLSPYLRRVVTNDSVEIKQIGNATLHVLGANSMANLKGTSSGRLIFDELDEWTDQQIYLAEQRAAGQKNSDKIVWGFSTPKYPNCGVHKQFLTSTQEHFHFDCPHCGEEIEFWDWKKCIEIKGDGIDDPAVHDSFLRCPECKQKLDHETKKDWLANGRWVSHNPDADPKQSRGFWISQLYSPTVTPGEIAIMYLRGAGDEAARREFHNSCLGLPYIEEAHQVTDEHVDACVKRFSIATSQPKNSREGVYTLGIDQGGPLHHWAAVKWMFDPKRFGDPNDRAVGRLVGFGRILQDDWGGVHALMRAYQVRMAVIDFFPNPTSPRVFARKFAGAVYLCQYTTGQSGREIRLTEDDYGANLVKADKVGWLTKTLGRLIAGDMELPLDLSLEFRQHVKAPIRTLKDVKGQYVAEYVEVAGRADHYAHALNYAEIALKILDPGIHPSSIINKIR